MKDAWLQRISLAAMILVLWPAGALAKPQAFSEQPFEQAKETARAKGKMLIVDFTASWCHPCHKMDDTTWSDTSVQKWIGANAIAVQIDVDKEKPIATSFNIRLMPTIVVFKPTDMSKEYDRRLGYQAPSQLLQWLDAAKGAKSTSTSIKERAAKAAGKDSEAEVEARYELAQKLESSGKYAEATDQCVWLWHNIPQSTKRMAGTRVTFLAMEMSRLTKEYPKAKDRFSALRAEALKSDNRTDWIVLNRVLDQEEQTLNWFDRVKSRRDQQEALLQERFMLQELLIRKKRWADVAVYLYKEPLKKLNDTYKMAVQLKLINENNDPIPTEAATLYTCFLAAHLDDKADKIARESLRLDNSRRLRILLVTEPFHAGFLKPSQLKWLDQMPPSTSPNFCFERASLYCAIGEYKRSLKDYTSAIAEGHPKAALYCSRGNAYYKLHQDQLALDDYNSAQSVEPKDAWSWVNKAALLYRQKKYSEAYAASNQAIHLDPKNLSGFCNRGEAALKLGHIADSVVDLTRATESTSPSCRAEAHYYRALAYRKLGRAELAAQDAQTATAKEFKPAEGE